MDSPPIAAKKISFLEHILAICLMLYYLRTTWFKKSYRMSLNLCFLGTDIRMKFTFIIVISYYVSQFCTWLGGSFVSHGANWGPGIAGKSKMASLIWPEVGTDHELGAQLELPARNLGPPPCICPHGCLCFLVAWRWGASQEVKTEARGTEITQNHLHQILFILPDVRVRPKDSGRRPLPLEGLLTEKLGR